MLHRCCAVLVCFCAADKTPIEVAQEAFKLGKKLKRSAAVVRELLERVSLWLYGLLQVGAPVCGWISAFVWWLLSLSFAIKKKGC